MHGKTMIKTIPANFKLKIMKNFVELTELDSKELMDTYGGKTPSKDTSFANDLAYYGVYTARAIWDGFAAFIDGASQGSKYFYK